MGTWLVQEMGGADGSHSSTVVRKSPLCAPPIAWIFPSTVSAASKVLPVGNGDLTTQMLFAGRYSSTALVEPPIAKMLPFATADASEPRGTWSEALTKRVFATGSYSSTVPTNGPVPPPIR